MTPQQRYHQQLSQGLLDADPAQILVVEHLERIYRGIVDDKAPVRPCSLYLWGRVGRGKSLLMDIFYDSLEGLPKRRVHFYRFMRDVHRRLADIQGQVDPLLCVADDIAREVRVLCFDEFFVSDIGDAMLLSGLFRRLFVNEVVIVATSNVEPDRLYENGLQRQRFIPAIEAIKANMLIHHIDGPTDHRLKEQPRSSTYFIDDDDAMLRLFKAICGERQRKGSEVGIAGRALPCRCLADDAVWFDFEALCLGPRSQNDYIRLADTFNYIFVSGVPQMGGNATLRQIAQGTEDSADGASLAKLNRHRQQVNRLESRSDDEARRFIALVDELYDRRVKLYLSAAVPVKELYLGGRLTMEFERTVSRLFEMQSVAYLQL